MKNDKSVSLGGLNLVITRAFPSNAAQQAKNGMVAKFSFDLVDENNDPIITMNNFFLYKKGNLYSVQSPFRIITDHDAPEEIPDDEAVKPLYFVSFFRGAKNNIDLADMKQDFFDGLAHLVLDKLKYFEGLKKDSPKKTQNELSNSTQ